MSHPLRVGNDSVATDETPMLESERRLTRRQGQRARIWPGTDAADGRFCQRPSVDFDPISHDLAGAL
jgi:hypothetical protein